MIGIVFNNSILFSRSPKLKRQKALFLPERQLVKDSAVLIKQNGEKIKGTLVLTYEHLIFLGNGKKEIKMVETSHASIGIDTPEDLDKARKMLK